MITIIIIILMSLGLISSESDYQNLSDTEKEFYQENFTDDSGEIIIDDEITYL